MATTVTATESATVSQLAQVVDLATSPSYKWFSLQDNKLDGTFHPVGLTSSSQVGWWGTQLSNTSGVFATPPALTINCDPTSIPSFQVAGDALLNEYPVDFTLAFYDAANVNLRTITVTGNTSVISKQFVSPTLNNVTKIVLTVSKVNKASRTVKIVDAVNIYDIASSDNIKVAFVESSSETISLSSVDSLAPKLAEVSNDTVSLSSADILTPKTDEVSSNTISFTRTDILAPLTVDSSSVTAQLSTVDTLTPKTDEATTPVSVSLSSTDILTPKTDEATTPVTVSFNTTDVLAPLIVEASSENISFTRADIIAPLTVDSSSVTAQLNRSDILAPLTVDTSLLTAQLSSADTLAPKTDEASTPVTASLSTADILTPKTDEATTPVSVSFNTADILAPLVVEVSSENISFTRTDILTPKIDEVSSENVSISTADTLAPNITEISAETVSIATTDILSPNLSETSSESVSLSSVDILTPMTAEISSQTVSFTRTDILTPNTADVSSLNVTVTTVDVLAPNIVEVTTMSVSVTSSDAIQVLTADASFFTLYEIWRNDVLTPKLDEVSSESVSLSSSDILTPKLDELSSETISFTRPDLLTPKMDESLSAITNNLSTVDALLPNTTEVSSQTVSFTRPDILTPKTDENTVITVNFMTADILAPYTNDDKAITVSFTRTDFILVGPMIEAEDFVANLLRPDSLYVSLSEEKILTNIHSVVDADYRQIFGRVQITYTDLFLDESVVATASGSGRYTFPEKTANGIESAGRKLFSLHENKLDGTYFPLGTGVESDNGWWSNIVSSATGTFAAGSEPTLTITFDARPIFYLQVIGDDQTNNYPVDFSVKLLDINNVLVNQTNVVGNTLVKWRQNLAVPYTGVAKMQLIINKINKPNSASKIMEFYTIIKEVYEGDDIISINLLEEQVFEDRSLPIGNVSANEIDIILDNVTGRFDPGNKKSTLYGTLKKNRRVQAWLGAEVVPGTVEWYSLGVFWTLDWNTPRHTTQASFSARDRLELMRRSDYKGTAVLTNIALDTLADMVLQSAGLLPSQYVIDPNLHNIVLPYAWFDRTTHRAALADIAIAALGRVYCDREGRVVVESYQPMVTLMYEFTDDTSIIQVDSPLRWSQIVNYVEATSSPMQVQAEEVVFDGGTDPLTIAANSTMVSVFVFNKIPVTQILVPTFTADPSVTITKVDYYSWGVEVTFQNTSVASQNITALVVRGRPLTVVGSRVQIAQDAINIRDNGKQPHTMKHRFIQNAARAQLSADSILATYKNPRFDAIVKSRGNPALRLGDRVRLPEYTANTTMDYQIFRQKIVWDGGLEAEVSAQKIGG